MTNNFTSRQTEHFVALTKELQGVSTSSAFVQSTVGFHVAQSKQIEATHSQGFGDILKALPSQKLKGFLEVLERLMERANSLTELLVLAQKQNERRRADERLAAEREISERRIRELEADNARLREALEKKKKRDPRPIPQTSEGVNVEDVSARGSSNSERLRSKLLGHQVDLEGPRGNSNAGASMRPSPFSELRSGFDIVQQALPQQQRPAITGALGAYQLRQHVIHTSEIQGGRGSDQEAGHGDAWKRPRRSEKLSRRPLPNLSRSRSRSRSPIRKRRRASSHDNTLGPARMQVPHGLESDGLDNYSELHASSEPFTQPLHLADPAYMRDQGLGEAEKNLLENQHNLRALSETLHGLLLDGQEVMMAKQEAEKQVVY